MENFIFCAMVGAKKVLEMAPFGMMCLTLNSIVWKYTFGITNKI